VSFHHSTPGLAHGGVNGHAWRNVFGGCRPNAMLTRSPKRSKQVRRESETPKPTAVHFHEAGYQVAGQVFKAKMRHPSLTLGLPRGRYGVIDLDDDWDGAETSYERAAFIMLCGRAALHRFDASARGDRDEIEAIEEIGNEFDAKFNPDKPSNFMRSYIVARIDELAREAREFVDTH